MCAFLFALRFGRWIGFSRMLTPLPDRSCTWLRTLIMTMLGDMRPHDALPILSLSSFNPYKWHHLGIGWFQLMSMFLHTINRSIILEDIWTPQPVRESDSILMDDFRNAIKLSEWEWAQVNYVRLWLRALTVADITDPSGRNIEAWARVGSRRLKRNLSCPRQEKPSPSVYCIWRKCLRLAYNPSSPSRLRL